MFCSAERILSVKSYERIISPFYYFPFASCSASTVSRFMIYHYHYCCYYSCLAVDVERSALADQFWAEKRRVASGEMWGERDGASERACASV